jgi:hypothetical protein
MIGLNLPMPSPIVLPDGLVVNSAMFLFGICALAVTARLGYALVRAARRQAAIADHPACGPSASDETSSFPTSATRWTELDEVQFARYVSQMRLD